MKTILFLVFAIGMFAAACNSSNNDNSQANKNQNNPSDDNLRRESNRNRSDAQTTTDDDLKITQKIREGLFDDTTLSLSAKNIKISVQNGAVILRGIVKSEKERNDIASKVNSIQGVTKVENQLQVSSDAI